MAEAEPADMTATSNALEPRAKGSAEQRQHRRYSVGGDAEVTVSGSSSLLRGRMLNLSAHGCYIQSIAGIRLDPGTLVDIHFRIDHPNFGWKIIQVRSEVSFCKPKIGIGFRFLRMKPATRETITAMIAILKQAEEALTTQVQSAPSPVQAESSPPESAR